MSWKLLLFTLTLLAIGITVATHMPAWATLLLGSSIGLAVYVRGIRVRPRPDDPRFGSCIPPIQTYRTDRKPPD